MARLIALLTDFGLRDPYVGQMKGVLAAQAPDAQVVDLCHRLEPFNILQAAFYLASSRPFFPQDTVFVAVIDPGVGGERRIVLLEKFGQHFLAPDNGLLSLVLQKPGVSRILDVTPPWRREASATFHGRDLIAPLAARLVNGTSPHELGEESNPHSLVRLPGLEPRREGDTLHASILHVDRFGNCITNLDVTEWGPLFFKGHQPVLLTPIETQLTPVFTYEKLESGMSGILRGSQGFLELAMNRESAAKALGLSGGSPITIRLEK